MTARARLVTQQLEEALVVPLEAAVPRDGGLVVFFVADERARAVPVPDGALHGDRLLLPGSIPYRELVLRGQRDLRDGAPVRVDNAILAGAPPP
jgi:multidrug efflux pump subunit AcrA (membrane-fusion protein)